MNVLMVWDGDYPWDVRVEKVCKTLIESGHKTHLVCRNSKGMSREEVTPGGIRIHRVFCFSGALRKLNPLITFPAFFSPVWISEIYRVCKKVKPDVIVIRDLPIALAVIPVARVLGIPTVFDMAECYPEMLRCIWKFEEFRFQNLFVRNPLLADFIERITIKNVNKIWVMIQESGDRLRKMGVPEENIRVVSNTPVHEEAVPISNSDMSSDEVRFVYIGLLNPSRGLRTVIKAAGILKSKGLKFRLTIAGSGKDYRFLEDLSEKLGLSDFVEFLGWVDHGRIREILARSHVGIVPHYRCSHWDNTIPNKLFDYMLDGIPVLVSDARPAARLVREIGSGIVYMDHSEEMLAESMEALFDANVRSGMGERGRAAIVERFNWSNDKKILLASLNEVAGFST